MSSVFGGDAVSDFNFTEQVALAGTTYIPTATSSTDAIVQLDNTITLVPSVNQPYVDIRLAIDEIANVAAVGAGIDSAQIANLYEANYDVNRFTNAYRATLDNIGTYIDASELAASQSAQDSSIASTYKTISSFNSDISNYRTSANQDTIDATKYPNSNPSGYQTSSQVSTAITSALVPYRTSADEDIINATKLNTADLISDIVPHPAGGAPKVFDGVVACGAINNGLAKSNTTSLTPFSPINLPALDIYDNVIQDVVNFKGSNFYSFQLAASPNAAIKETNGIYTVLSKSDVFTTQTASTNFVYKFAANNDILVAISQSTTCSYIFYTTDGITWVPYFDDYGAPKREVKIYDGIVYIGTDYDIQKISVADLIANVDYTTAVSYHSALTLINSLVKLNTTDFLILTETGIFTSDLNGTQFTASGSPPGASTANPAVGKITVAPWAIYCVPGTGALSIYKSTNAGLSWTEIVISESGWNTVDAIHYSSDLDLVLFGGYTTTSVIGTIDSSETITYTSTGGNYNQQDGSNYYVYDFGEVYTGGAGGAGGVSVLLDAGASTTENVYDTLIDLSTANNELRTTLNDYALSADVSTEIAASQAAQNFNIGLTYLTQSNAASTYLTSANAASTYRTIASSYSASETDTLLTNTLVAYPTNTYLTTNYSTTTDMNTAITNANNTQNTSIASTYQTQAAMSAYYTSSQTNTAISDETTSQNAFIAANYATLTQFSYLLRPNIRFVVASGGSTSPASGQAFSTISSALAASSANQVVFVFPGTYNESSLTIPAGVELKGASRFSTKIQFTATSSNTMITVGGANCKLSDITLELTSSTNGANLTCVSIGSTYNTSFYMRNCELSIINGIGLTDTANCYCINSTATGAHVDDSVFNYIDCVFRVNSGGLGIKRCVYSSGANSDLHFDTCQFSCINTIDALTANRIAFEVNGSGADSQLTNSHIHGITADISQTQGTIRLGKSTILSSPSSNGLSFVIMGGGWDWAFGDPGTIANGTNYMYRGSDNMTSNEVQYRVNKPSVLYGMYLNARIAPGVGNSATITVRKNGVDTAATLALSGTTTNASLSSVSVGFATGDLISLKIVNVGGGGNACQDIVTQLDFY